MRHRGWHRKYAKKVSKRMVETYGDGSWKDPENILMAWEKINHMADYGIRQVTYFIPAPIDKTYEVMKDV